MKPPPFDYCSPSTVQEVVDLLGRYGADARILAGGQSLVPLMNLRLMRPAVLIDLNRCRELDYIDLRGDELAFGPMVRQIKAAQSPLVHQHCPLVAQALSWTGPVAVRSRATVGGTLAHADRVAELPAAAMALDATMVIQGPRGTREVPAQAFFLGDLSTAVEPDEFLREIRFPVAAPGERSHFIEVSVRQEGVAVVGVAIHLDMAGDRIAKAAVVAMGVDAVPQRLIQVEQALQSRALDAQTAELASRCAFDQVDPASDPYASAGYRRHVVAQLVGRAFHSIAAQESLNEQ